MLKKKAPIYKLSRSKAPKHSSFSVADIWEKPVDFLYDTAQTSALFPGIILQT